MAKYIKCEAVLELIRPDDPNDERCAVTVATAKRLIRHALTAAPAADVAPVVHGEWEIVVGSNGKEYMVCTCCRVSQDLTGVFTYWPNCGALMDVGDSDEAD